MQLHGYYMLLHGYYMLSHGCYMLLHGVTCCYSHLQGAADSIMFDASNKALSRHCFGVVHSSVPISMYSIPCNSMQHHVTGCNSM